MDELTFDRVTRLFGELGSRRTTVLGLLGAGGAFAVGRLGPTAEAKKKKKKKKKKKCRAPNTKCGKNGC